jgi:3-hydroxyisobutyrate dehydrogenase/glyoxylate/succinic semialdehyde reductase
MKIGFIGMGTMGSRMAANLLKHGHSLVVHNRTRAKAQSLLAKGAKWAESPGALAQQVDTIFTMLAHPNAVEEAVIGRDGFFRQLRLGQMWVDCSTVNPSFSKSMAAEMHAEGVHFLGAPVSGSKAAAEHAELIFWVGGDMVDLETCRPLLQCMGSKIVHCGGAGMGAALKMVMNQLLGTQLAAFAEGLVLGESLGLCRKVLFEALFNGPAAPPFVAIKQDRIETGNFGNADFALRWLQKDLHLASVSAYESGVAMPLTNVAKEIYRQAVREGHGNEDISAIYAYLARNQDAASTPVDSPE